MDMVKQGRNVYLRILNWQAQLNAVLLRASLILAFTLIKFKVLFLLSFLSYGGGGSKWGTQFLSIPTFLPAWASRGKPQKTESRVLNRAESI